MATQLIGYGELIGALDNDYMGYDEEVGVLSEHDIGARGAQRTVKADRRYTLGLGSVSVPAGGTAQLSGAPTLKFRVDRLMLVSTAPGVVVTSIVAGNVLQSLGGGGSPVESFAPNAFGASMAGQSIDPAIPVVVTLVNPTGAAIQVAGNVFGLADQ